MFNKNFYPTPDDTIKLMLDKIRKGNIRNILEPSAGKGNIIDYIHSHNYEYKNFAYKVNIDAIEIEEDLKAILIRNGWLDEVYRHEIHESLFMEKLSFVTVSSGVISREDAQTMFLERIFEETQFKEKLLDKVIFNKFSGNEIEDGDIKYLIVNADDILAVIE